MDVEKNIFNRLLNLSREQQGEVLHAIGFDLMDDVQRYGFPAKRNLVLHCARLASRFPIHAPWGSTQNRSQQRQSL
jgi:hypothetical protein